VFRVAHIVFGANWQAKNIKRGQTSVQWVLVSLGISLGLGGIAPNVKLKEAPKLPVSPICLGVKLAQNGMRFKRKGAPKL
jgi:hypothetical protein